MMGNKKEKLSLMRVGAFIFGFFSTMIILFSAPRLVEMGSQLRILEQRLDIISNQTYKNTEHLRDLEIGQTQEDVFDYDSTKCYLVIEEVWPGKHYVAKEYLGRRNECPPDELYFNERYEADIEVNIR